MTNHSLSDPDRSGNDADDTVTAPEAQTRVLPMSTAASQAFAAAEYDVRATFDIIAQRQAIQAAGVGIWALEPHSGELHCDARGRALFGLPATPAPRYEMLLNGLHEADAPRFSAALETAMSGEREARVDLTCRGRVEPEAGAERWLSVNGRCVFDPAGRPRRITGTVLDVSRQYAAAAEREGRMQALERDLYLADLFAGILGHDLRNPLSAIATSADLLRRRANSPRVGVPAGRIVKSAARMGRMIDQLLDFARIRLGGGMPLCVQPVDLAALCRQVAAELAAGGGRNPLRLTSSGDTGGEWDRDRLWQLLANVIGNALSHGVDGTTVHIHIDGERAAEVGLEVSNEGAIPESLQTALFEPLRIAATRTRAGSGSSGLGLGLFISHQIALAHRGSITVASGPAAQTRLTLTLPRHAQTATRE